MAVKVTNRKPLKGNDRSHALNSTKRARKLNLQVVRLEDGTKVRMTVREKRTLNKENNTKSQNNNYNINEVVEENVEEEKVENNENEEASL